MRLALILSALLFSISPARAQDCAATHAAQAEAEIVAGINSLRAGAGAAPVQANRTLARIAQGHACDNAARNSYSHSGSDGSDLTRRLTRGGYDFRAAAENTGLGHDSAQQMLDFWTRSPGHRANMLDPALREAGLGRTRTAGGRNVWVLVMGRR